MQNIIYKTLNKMLTVFKPKSSANVIVASVPHMDSFEFYVHSVFDQYITGDLVREKIWEPFETEVFRRLCRPDDFIVDIGANIGWYSVIASRLVGKSGKVLSIEPDITNVQLLEKNISNAGGSAQIEILNIALGDTQSESRLFLSPVNLGDHRLFDDQSERESIPVNVQTLDHMFLNSNHRPTFIKSDTQGSEAKILRGARGLFASAWRPVLILEFWPFGLVSSGDDPANLWESLRSLGYIMFEVNEENKKLLSLSESDFRVRLDDDLSPQSQRFINILCLPEDSDREPSVRELIDTSQ